MHTSSESDKQYRKAKHAVFRLLKIRLRSEKELCDKLKLKGFSHNIISKTIDYFKDIQLINDREFAQRWISSRQSKPYGQNRIRFELMQKGINQVVLQEELSKGFEDYSEDDIVCQLAKKRAQKYEGIEPIKQRKRIYDYLQRRGFSLSSIQKAMKTYDS